MHYLAKNKTLKLIKFILHTPDIYSVNKNFINLFKKLFQYFESRL